MKCALCGLEFEEKEAQKACRGCALAANCRLVRCPNCGYESPLEPEFLKRIKKWRRPKK